MNRTLGPFLLWLLFLVLDLTSAAIWAHRGAWGWAVFSILCALVAVCLVIGSGRRLRAARNPAQS